MFIRPPYGSGMHVGAGSPEARWLFVQKVYSILAIQMLLMVVVASMVVYVRPVKLFVLALGGMVLYISSLILPIIALCHMYFFYQSYPVNLFSLGVFIVTMSLAVGLTCAFTKGEIIIESVILTLIILISLTVYTFWAVKNAHKISFLEGWQQYLFAAAIFFMAFLLIQIFFPLERMLLLICGGLPSLIFCAYVIYETNNFIGLFSKEEYVWAVIAPYVDIIYFFLHFKDECTSLTVTKLGGVLSKIEIKALLLKLARN